MNKKLISRAILLALMFCGLNFQQVGAITEEGLITRYGDGHCAVEGDIGIPCPTDCFDEAGKFQVCYLNEDGTVTALTDEEVQNMLEEGISGEPEVVCADADEPDCDTNNPELTDDEESEPALWPVFLSLGAIAVSVVLIIIINIASRRKK